MAVKGGQFPGSVTPGESTMAAVVVVHGIGKQYKSAGLLHGCVAAALCGGVEHAGHQPPEADDIAMAFYGNLFRQEGRRGDSGPDGAELSTVEQDLVVQWWRAAARIDPENVQHPDDTADARAPVPVTVKAALRALSMSRFATKMTERALYGSLRQVQEYLYGDKREPVLERVCGLITPPPGSSSGTRWARSSPTRRCAGSPVTGSEPWSPWGRRWASRSSSSGWYPHRARAFVSGRAPACGGPTSMTAMTWWPFRRSWPDCSVASGTPSRTFPSRATLRR